MPLDFTQLEIEVKNLVTIKAGAEAILTALETELATLASEIENPADQQKILDFAAQISIAKSALAAAIAAVPAADLPPAAAAPVSATAAATDLSGNSTSTSGHVFTGSPSELGGPTTPTT